VRRGAPERELPALAREVGAAVVHCSADVGLFARRRDPRVAAEIELVAPAGLNVVDEVTEVRTRQGRPYTVFSPFHRTWSDVPRRDVLRAPRSLPPLPARLRKGRLPSLRSLGLRQEVDDPLPGGETAARARLRRYLADGVRSYDDDHDQLGGDRSSRLSAYLHFGACRRARSRRGSRRAPARRRSGATVLARLLPPRPRPPSGQRAVRVPGALYRAV
jgi:deoxyribodipyrimidine photo-lyase